MASEPRLTSNFKPRKKTFNHASGRSKFVTISHSPYYLHPFEGRNASIIDVVFKGTNHDIWDKAIRTVLKAKNKLGFRDEILEKQER